MFKFFGSKPGEARRIEENPELIDKDEPVKVETLTEDQKKSLDVFKKIVIGDYQFHDPIELVSTDTIVRGTSDTRRDKISTDELEKLNKASMEILKGEKEDIKKYLGLTSESEWNRTWTIASEIITNFEKIPVAKEIVDSEDELPEAQPWNEEDGDLPEAIPIEEDYPLAEPAEKDDKEKAA